MTKHSSYISVTDQFCGAGGSSTGAVQAGLEVRLAINHWKLAIETHNTNHPDTLHECTDISACDPRRYPSTTILLTSPECTNHSLAKGKRRLGQNQLSMFATAPLPEEERSRATMWDVPRFAEYHDYEAIIVENVVDARYWAMWDAWLLAMHLLGYKHECVYLNSMHAHPTPQSRDRMYIVFWKKGNKSPDLQVRPRAHCPICGDVETFQSWKNSEKKWGKYRTQYLYRCSGCNEVVEPYYYAAFNAIDWTIQAPKIGDRTKPLSEKTMARIHAGLKKYGQTPMVVATRYSSGIENRVKPALSSAIGTQPGDVSHGIAIPFLMNSEYDGAGEKTRPLTAEAWTQTTRQTAAVCVPPAIIIENFGKSKGGRPAAQPAGTVTAGGITHGLLLGNYSPGWARSTAEPTGTVTTADHHSIVSGESLSAFLQYYYSGVQTSHITEGLRTVTATDRAALVQPHPVDVDECRYRMLRPHEIKAAMAFPSDYIVLGSGRDQVKQLGNAVTPPAMKWLVERVVESFR